MSRRKDRARTPGLWIATNALPVTGGHRNGQRLPLGDRLKEMGVEHLRAIAPVETFDVGILVGRVRLDVVDRHPVVGAVRQRRDQPLIGC